MIKNVVLDFGHGGLTPDGVYTTAPNKMHKFPNGEVALEGVLNRQIGGMLELLFRANRPQLNVVTTVASVDPRDVSLSYRVRVANQFNPAETIFISIHSNAFNGQARGFELFTTHGITKSDDLAEAIAQSVEIFYNRINLKLRYDFTDGDRDKESDFYVLRKTACPAVLLECLFFDNWEDYQYLKDPEFQKELAWYIYTGAMKYIEQN